MSTFEHIALQQPATYGLGDPLTVGLPRRVNGMVGRLGDELWIVRLVVCCGFAGAVLLQAGIFSLFARHVLMLDAAMLPGPAASTYLAVVGAAVMLASRALSTPRAAASFR